MPRLIRYRHDVSIIALCALGLLLAGAGGAHQAREREAAPSRSQSREATIIIDGTLQAALAQPRVHVQLLRDRKPLEGEPLPGGPAIPGIPGVPGLDDREDHRTTTSFQAILDTGASSHVLSASVTKRFKIESVPEAVFNEVGLHGAHQVGVSVPYDLGLAGHSGSMMDEPPAPPGGGGRGRGGRGSDEFTVIQKNIALQLSRDEPRGAMALMGELNVIGMPAIRKMVIEIDPLPMRGGRGGGHHGDVLTKLERLGAGPVVRLLDARSKPKPSDIDIEIPLEYLDFNQRKHPENRGPLPELASNPMLMRVQTARGTLSYTSDWLLDTGAAASIISTRHAQALGLYDAEGKPAAPPQFTLPLGGISGDTKQADGFVIDRLTLAARPPGSGGSPGTGGSGKTIEFRNVHVVVIDVGAQLDDGREVILDGVFAMNLLLPSVSLSAGLPDQSHDGGFERIWIDGPRGMLMLKTR